MGRRLHFKDYILTGMPSDERRYENLETGKERWKLK